MRILLREGISGTEIWRGAGGVRGELWGSCGSAAPYPPVQFSILWLCSGSEVQQSWGFRITFPTFHGLLKFMAQFSHGYSIVLPSGGPQGSLLQSSNLFLVFPAENEPLSKGNPLVWGGIHQEESWASLNIAMQMRIFKKIRHQSSRIMAAGWNLSCFMVLVQQHYNLILSRRL